MLGLGRSDTIEIISYPDATGAQRSRGIKGTLMTFEPVLVPLSTGTGTNK